MNHLRAHLSIAILVAMLAPGCGGSASSEPAASDTATSSGAEQNAASSDLVDTAVAAGSFSTLVQAVQAAGLEDTLRGPGPFTVFAPTDAAFAALPAGTVESLLLPENREQLRAVLTYHVVSGDVRASQVVGMSEATSVQGSPIRIATEGGQVRLNESATVTATDIAASNGVIHVIDAVILPPS